MKITDWLKQSNRWKHVLGGFVIGIIPAGWFAGLYGGVIAASALEFKDRMWGGKWDWIDWALTVAGAAAGCGIRLLI